MTDDFKIGFAGMGVMGQAMLRGITAAGALPPARIAVLSRSEAGRQAAREAGAALCSTPDELAGFAHIVILAVKPKDSLELIGRLCPALDGKALLSIVAGLNYQTIRERLCGAQARLLVALPNTPVQAGAGVIAFTNETDFTEEERRFAEALFAPVAHIEWISEKLLGALSALSGSGPAYAALFAEALADGGVLEGLPRAQALRLAALTLAGAGRLLAETGMHPAALKDAVCSPGGTTIEGVAALEAGAFRAQIIGAVRSGADKFKRLVSV